MVLLRVGEVHRRGQPQIAGDRGQPLRAGRGVPHRHEPIGAGVRQRAEEYGVDEAEDGGVGGDADRQCQQRRARERGAAAQRADAVADVAREIVDPRDAALIAAGVHRLGEAGGGRPRAGVGGEREVRAQLLLEIGVAPIRAHQVADADDPLAQGGHAAGLMAARRPRGARA